MPALSLTPFRRSILATSVAALAAIAVLVGGPGLVTAQPASDDTSIRPFHIHIPEEALVDLRKRVLATRWPAKETVTDQSQGVQLEKLQDLRDIGAPATTGGRSRRS